MSHLISVGMPAIVKSPLKPNVEMPARVAAILPNFNAGSATSAVRIEFTGPERIVAAGAPAEAMVITQSVPDAIVIPAAALFQDDNGAFHVFVAGKDGRAHRVPVTIGIRNQDQVQVTAGIAARRSGDHLGRLCAVRWTQSQRRASEQVTKPRVTRSNSILAMLAVVGLTILGVLLAFSIPSSVFPEMTFNRAIIMADSGDLPPEQMLVTVTRPLEETAYGVIGVSLVRSTTTRGTSEIDVTFSESVDPTTSFQLLNAALGEVRGRLPAEPKSTRGF